MRITLCDAVAAIRRKVAIQPRAAALAADEIDRRETQVVVSLMEASVQIVEGESTRVLIE